MLQASSTHKSGSHAPGSAAPDPSPLIVLAAPPRRSLPSAASIFRLVFFMVRSVYQNGTASAPPKPLVQNPGSTSEFLLAATAQNLRKLAKLSRCRSPNQPER